MNEYKTTRRIEFSDTDMAGIIHFSRYFVFMEIAEHEFWNAVGTSVHCEIEGRKIGWPRVSAECDFFRPVRFEDVVEIVVKVEHKGTKSLTLSYDFLHAGTKVAHGRMTTVCCELTEHGPRGIPIPGVLNDCLEVHPEFMAR